MTEGQKYLLKLYKEVDAICRENNIRYYLAGGTLIGAVRHRGFVPWDDDFDLYMTRNEFEKFVEVAKRGGLPENRRLECQEISRTYRNVFARYTDLSTTAIHKNQLITDDVAGEVLDILQLDPVPDDASIHKKHFKRLMLYADLINPSAPYSSRCDWNKYTYLFYKTLMGICGKEKVLRLLEQKLFQYKEEDCDTYIMRWSGAPLIFKKELFEPAIEIEFEGVKATIPRGYNQYLIDHYGDDWMYIPKVDSQLSHEAVHSFVHNYHLIRKSYTEVIDKNRLMHEYEERKRSILFSAKQSHKVADKIVTLRGVKLKEELLFEIEEKKLDLSKLYEQNKYMDLEKLFAKYYNMQGNAQFSGRDTFKAFYRFQNPILIDLPINVLNIALRVQNDIGKTGKAMRTIEIYEQVKGRLSKELETIKKIILLQREAMNHYSLGEIQETKNLTEVLIRDNPNNIIVLKLLIKCLIMEDSNNDYVKQLINRGIALYPKDGEFLKYKGDLVYKKNKKKACQIYKEAKEKTENGCVLLEIEDNIQLYVNELMEQLKRCFSASDYIGAEKVYKEIISYKHTSEAEYLFLDGMLNENIDENKAYDMYIKAQELIPDIERNRIEELLARILAYCGEWPIVSLLHIKVLYAIAKKEDIKQLKKELLGKISNMEKMGLNICACQMRKFLGDLYKYEGDINNAYIIYREVFVQLDESSVSKRDLKKLFLGDIEQLKEMSEHGVHKEDLKTNFSIKFVSQDNIKKVLQIDELTSI